MSPNTSYTFSVKAIGTGIYDSSIAATTNAITKKTQLAIPTNLKVDTSTDTIIELSWTANSNASGYKVYRDSSADGQFTTEAANIPNGSTTTATITGLTAYTTYYFKIKAIGSGIYSDSELSGAILAKTNKTKLTTPVITNIDTTDNSITFSWTVVPNASSYIVYLSTSEDSGYKKVTVTPTINGTTASVTITDLTKDTTYYFKVRAIGTGIYSDSDDSDPDTAIPGKNPLKPPTNLKIDASTDTTITLSWTANPNASGYEVHRSTVGVSGTSTLVTDPTSDATNDASGDRVKVIVTTGLSPNTTYEFSVKALGTGIYSDSPHNIITATTKKLKLQLTNLKVDESTDTTITLSWTATPNAGGYIVTKSTGGATTPVTDPTSDATSDASGGRVKVIVTTGLSPNTTYTFSVIANGTGAFESSAPATIDAKTKTKLQPPGSLRVDASTDTTITLSWTANSSASGYKIYQSTTDNVGLSSPVTDVSGGGTNTAVIGNLTQGTTYYFRIQAIGDGDYVSSGLSNSVSDKTKTKLGEPQGLRVDASTDTTITLSWTANPLASSYKIYQSTTDNVSSSSAVTDVSGGNTNTFVIGSLAQNTPYYFKIQAIGSGNYVSSGLSNSVSDKTKTKLDTPQNLKIDASSDTTITLLWTAVTNASGYKIYRDNGAGGGVTIETTNDITGSSTTTAIITGLTANTTYNFKIKATGSGIYVDSNLTNSVSGTTKAATSESLYKPAFVVIYDKDINANNATLKVRWNTVLYAMKYEIEYTTNTSIWADKKILNNTIQDVTSDSSNSDPINKKEIDINNLTPGIEYFVRIKAYDELGNYSPYSDIKSMATPAVGSVKLTATMPMIYSEVLYFMGDFNNNSWQSAVKGTCISTDTSNNKSVWSVWVSLATPNTYKWKVIKVGLINIEFPEFISKDETFGNNSSNNYKWGFNSNIKEFANNSNFTWNGWEPRRSGNGEQQNAFPLNSDLVNLILN